MTAAAATETSKRKDETPPPLAKPAQKGATTRIGPAPSTGRPPKVRFTLRGREADGLTHEFAQISKMGRSLPYEVEVGTNCAGKIPSNFCKGRMTNEPIHDDRLQ